ncbi:MAG: hypothetical protein ABI134_30015 [Byssovorax sp.]
MESIKGAILRGEVLFHEDLAAACSAAVHDLDCDASLGELLPRGLASAGLGECAGVLEGRLRAGASCTSDVACAGDAACAAVAGSAPTCQELPGAGGLCANGRCRAGLACVKGACTADKHQDGEACEKNDECDTLFCQGAPHFACSSPVGLNKPCLRDTDCSQVDQKSFCSAEDGTCAEARLNPLPCNRSSMCKSGYCGENGQCSPLLTSGMQCDSDAECESAHCKLSGQCAWPRETAKVGTSCGEGECIPSAFCYLVSGKCEGKFGLNALCSESQQCASNRCGGPLPKRCIAALAPGTACTSGGECSSSTCVNGMCEGLHTSGKSCVVNANCAPGLVCDPTGAKLQNYVCTSKNADLTWCTKDAACKSGTCDIDDHFCWHRKQGDVCKKHAACEAGTYCEGLQGERNNLTGGHCAPLRANGDACTLDVGCESGLCRSRKCVAPRSDGASCAVEDPLACQHAVCATQQASDPTCHPRPQCYL